MACKVSIARWLAVLLMTGVLGAVESAEACEATPALASWFGPDGEHQKPVSELLPGDESALRSWRHQIIQGPLRALDAAFSSRLLTLRVEWQDASKAIPGLAMAYYEPIARPASDLSNGLVPSGQEGFLSLHPASYLDSDGCLRPFEDLPVDAAEYAAHALALAGFYNTLLQSGAVSSETRPAWRDELDQQAAALYPEVTDEAGRAQFVTAAASFLSHVIALRGEISRSVTRALVGPDPSAKLLLRLCRLVSKDFGLYRNWRKTFHEEVFQGYAVQQEAQAPLTPANRKFLVRAFLGASYTGDARADFALPCEDVP